MQRIHKIFFSTALALALSISLGCTENSQMGSNDSVPNDNQISEAKLIPAALDSDSGIDANILEKSFDFINKAEKETPIKPQTKQSLRYFQTGNTLLEQKDNPYFLGYLAGVTDTLGVIEPEFREIEKSYMATLNNEEMSNDDYALFAMLIGGAASRGTIDKTSIAAKLPEGDGVTLGQIQGIVNKYLSDHPGDLNQPAAILVWSAMADLSGSQSIFEHRREEIKRLLDQLPSKSPSKTSQLSGGIFR